LGVDAGSFAWVLSKRKKMKITIVTFVISVLVLVSLALWALKGGHLSSLLAGSEGVRNEK